MSHQEKNKVLATQLNIFAERINGQPSLRSTLAGWQPEFYIQSRDTEATFQIHFSAGKVERVEPVDVDPGDEALLLRADHAVLQTIFNGDLSPLGAYTDGLLEVYGSQKDQIKLDVIALVVWGA